MTTLTTDDANVAHSDEELIAATANHFLQSGSKHGFSEGSSWTRKGSLGGRSWLSSSSCFILSWAGAGSFFSTSVSLSVTVSELPDMVEHVARPKRSDKRSTGARGQEADEGAGDGSLAAGSFIF